MFKRLLLIAAFAILASPAEAQNTTCSNRPAGDSSNACANTRFVQQNAGGGSITPESCGAKGDGTTDDAPAIRQCMASLGAQPLGGKLTLTCNRTYLLASKSSAGNGRSIIHPYSNVTIQGCGDSSVLKVADGMNLSGHQFLVIYPPDNTITYNYTNVAFRDFKIDENGVNNATFAQQNVAIGILFGTGVVIDNVTMVNNPGSQYVVLGENASISVADAVINNVRFGDACSLIAGSPCTDHSSIYAVASNYTISNTSCKFSTPSAQGTCFEMHGYNGTAVGVQVENYEKVVNIAAQVGHTATNMTVTGVNANNTLYGVTLWCDGTAPLANIVINGNTWRQRAVASTLAYHDFADAVTATACMNGVTYSNNLYHWDGVSSASTTPTLKIGRGQNIAVLGNTFVGSNGPCIGNGTVAAETSFRIEGNTLIDCGQTSTAASQRGILLSSATQILNATIRGNKIQNVASAYMATCLAVTLNSSTASWVYPDNVMVCGTQSALTLTGNFFLQNSAGVMFIQNPAGVPGSTAALSGAVLHTNTASTPSLSRSPLVGVAGTAVGQYCMANATSGSVCFEPATGALGTAIVTVQAGTYTLPGLSLDNTWSGTVNNFTNAVNAGTQGVNNAMAFYMGTSAIRFGRNTSQFTELIQDGSTSRILVTTASKNFLFGTTDTGNIQFYVNNAQRAGLTVDGFSSLGWLGAKAPVTLTGTSGTVAASDASVIFNPSGAFTATLPACNATNSGRWLDVKSIAAQTVASASANVVPRAGGAAGTAILAAAAGNWARLQCDATSWIIMAGN